VAPRGRLFGDEDLVDDDDDVGASPKTAEAPGDGRIAEVVMARLRTSHRSALDYVRHLDFGNPRAGHEARRTAQALDALIKEGVPLHFEGMEILVRNLVGVCEADRFGDTCILEGLEWALPQDVVPSAVLRTVMKDAKRRKELKPKPQRGSVPPAPRDPKKAGQPGAGKK
jgi:hypothetical protein